VAETLEEIAREIAVDSGLGKVRSVSSLAGGRNNRVARVEFDDQIFLLKNYFYSVNDQRDRLNSEYSFADFAWASGCRRIAKPVFRSNRLRSALYEYVPGVIVNSRAINDRDIRQAIDFVIEINAQKENAPTDFPIASEAGFSVTEHLQNTERRIMRLSEISGDTAPEVSVQEHVRDIILPLWDKVVAAIRRVLKQDPPVAHVLNPQERWLSPSDFGFHNAIQRENGHIAFIDFEFAGWDDPVKLICDFANQPDNILADDLSGQFMRSLFESKSGSDQIQVRHRLLQPVFQLKWVCIILNHFLPIGKDRNLFTSAEDLEIKKIEQVLKMQRMLSRAEASAALI
jgi:hypothetical protein